MKLSFAFYDHSNYPKIQNGRHLGKNWHLRFNTYSVGATKLRVILVLAYIFKLIKLLGHCLSWDEEEQGGHKTRFEIHVTACGQGCEK